LNFDYLSPYSAVHFHRGQSRTDTPRHRLQPGLPKTRRPMRPTALSRRYNRSTVGRWNDLPHSSTDCDRDRSLIALPAAPTGDRSRPSQFETRLPTQHPRLSARGCQKVLKTCPRGIWTAPNIWQCFILSCLLISLIKKVFNFLNLVNLIYCTWQQNGCYV